MRTAHGKKRRSSQESIQGSQQSEGAAARHRVETCTEDRARTKVQKAKMYNYWENSMNSYENLIGNQLLLDDALEPSQENFHLVTSNSHMGLPEQKGHKKRSGAAWMAATQGSKKSAAAAGGEIQPESLLDEIKREVSEYSQTQQNFRGKKSNSGTLAKP